MTMAQHIQYDMFRENDPVSLLRQEVDLLREEIATLRRSQFARLNSMGKLFLDQEGQAELKKKKEKKDAMPTSKIKE